MKTLKLYCIPYSGGSAEIYLKWKRFLPETVTIVPVELAGRGKRIRDSFYENCDNAVKDIADIILEDIKEGEEYAILGHSMGALLAFETYYELLKRNKSMPIHMFFSGRKAPQNMDEKTQFYLLPDEEFLQVVYAYGGNTSAIMNNSTLRELFLPILRADFKISEIYEYKLHPQKIECPITLINGTKDDSIFPFDMNEWKYFAGSKFSNRQVEGNHFFVIENIKGTTDVLIEELGMVL